MRMIGDVNSTLNIKLEKELLEGISSAAVASGRHRFMSSLIAEHQNTIDF